MYRAFFIPFLALALWSCGDDSGSGQSGDPAAMKGAFVKRCDQSVATNLRIGQRGFDKDLQDRMRKSVEVFCRCFADAVIADKVLKKTEKAGILSSSQVAIFPLAGMSKDSAAAYKKLTGVCYKPMAKSVFGAADEHIRRQRKKNQ